MLAKETETKATPTMRPVRLVSAVSSRLSASETARNSSVNLMGETLAVRIRFSGLAPDRSAVELTDGHDTAPPYSL